jgi:arylsulfatase B
MKQAGICWMLVLILCSIPVAQGQAGAPPNIVILLADDLGWNDIGYHNPEILTPNLDAFVAGGLELDRFYVAPVCTPTRAGLMTGRYGIRYGMQEAAILQHELHGMPASEELIPEMLARAGYTHRALSGKWHLGHLWAAYHPLQHGFTETYGAYTGSFSYDTHFKNGELDWHRGYDPSFDTGYSTDLIADEAIRFIQDRAGEAPFFLYVAFNAPHTPLSAKQECEDRYPGLTGTRKTFAAVVSCMDDAIGRILQTLDDLQIRDNTFVLFLSDNGGDEDNGGDNAPLRDDKGEVYEGGIRVPAALAWPGGGLLPPGTVLTTPMTYVDIFPTLMRMAGLADQEVNPLDGVDMLDLLQGGRAPERDFYSFFVNLRLGAELMALHDGPWKLRYQGADVRVDPGLVELFLIGDDPLETTDLSAQQPTVVAEMLEQLKTFRSYQVTPHIDSYRDEPVGWVPPVQWQMPEVQLTIPAVIGPDQTEVFGTDATLSWHPTPDAATYEVELTTDSTFHTLVVTFSGLVDTSLVASSLLLDTPYYWRVRGVNTRKDNYSFWPPAATFTLRQAPFITVTSPNGGEVWTMGTSQTITWVDNLAENVTLRLLKGNALSLVIHRNTASDGSFAWTIPTTLVPGSDYKLRVVSKTNASLRDDSDASFTIEANSGAARAEAAQPTGYHLETAYPNPFNPATVIRYHLPGPTAVRLVVYDLLGREVLRLVEGTQPAGEHAVTFEARNLPSGMYLYQLQAGGVVVTRQMLLLK